MIEKHGKNNSIGIAVQAQEGRIAEIKQLQHDHKMAEEALIHDLIRGGHYDCFTINRRATYKKFVS